jgi:hypothetical protein
MIQFRQPRTLASSVAPQLKYTTQCRDTTQMHKTVSRYNSNTQQCRDTTQIHKTVSRHNSNTQNPLITCGLK